MEHVWDALGRRIAARLHHPENTQQLKQMLIEEWVLLPQEMLHQLVLSMRRRCEATIAAFVYNVCTVRKGVVIHKHKFSTHGPKQMYPKQTYMLFQNYIPIDVAYHVYTLNMQVNSGTKNNSSPQTRHPPPP
ncbi:uncharacterized protein TNCV_4648611 [Trichonephila clavipes]|uniref:Uncharacterized protein n=1 Tax=Trichonephila clavipes TaxID=2585209 RepID=A0A8X6VRU8_TRICX|nr:uncharacterized protein TNCV_4648611 [Trichonephila clavipes]